MSVTVSATGTALVILTAGTSNGGLGACSMSFGIGASTASDTTALTVPGSLGAAQSSATFLVKSLGAGVQTFTAYYKAGGNTCTFSNRSIIVIPY